MNRVIRGYYRLCLVLVALAFGSVLIVLTAPLPITIKGYRLVYWTLHVIARAALWMLNVQAVSEDTARMRQHAGFFFANHVSYVDILVLLSVAPTRFLAKDEVRRMPLIGLAARAIGCVFVRRGDRASRHQARQALVGMDSYHPAVTIFPEGQRSETAALLPFRYGAFEIATRHGIPILPCVIVYARPELVIWDRRLNGLLGLWRLVSGSQERIEARVATLAPVRPMPTDDPVALSLDLRAEMTAVYRRLWPVDAAIQPAETSTTMSV